MLNYWSEKNTNLKSHFGFWDILISIVQPQLVPLKYTGVAVHGDGL